MSWRSVLDAAAQHLNGGCRSFPLARDQTHPYNLPYEPLNIHYERLLYRNSLPSSAGGDRCTYSAGWMLPRDNSVCHPVFVANSLLAAIWLVEASLPKDTLSSDGWKCLVSAAQDLAQEDSDLPPSAQSLPSPRRETPKRPASSHQESSPKRMRQESASAPPTQSPSAPCEDEEELAGSVVGITTVTNHNRRAELQRAKKKEKKEKKEEEVQRIALGLVPPPPSADRKEYSAYTSLPPDDAPLLSWIFKQPYAGGDDFFMQSKTPYLTAHSLLEKARALGNPFSQLHAAQFLEAWRGRGSLFRPYGALTSSQRDTPPNSLQISRSQDEADRAFRFAWNMCDRAEKELATVHIENRWASALLGQAYAKRIEHIQHADQLSSRDQSRNRYGKGRVSTEAFADMFKLVSADQTSADQLNFKARMHKARRWYTLSQVLGWGVFCLIPSDLVPNSWIESTLRVPELQLWADVVRKVNPDVYHASQALDHWLGADGIAGGPLSEKKYLGIEAEWSEAKSLATTYEIEEIQDSDFSGDDGDDGEEIEASQSQASPKSCTPAPQLRQLTLSELFNPVSSSSSLS